MNKVYFECDCGLGDKKLEGLFKETKTNEDDTCVHCGNYAVARSTSHKPPSICTDPLDLIIEDDPYTAHLDLNGYESPYKTNT
jgi:hypothetical protein